MTTFDGDDPACPEVHRSSKEQFRRPPKLMGVFDLQRFPLAEIQQNGLAYVAPAEMTIEQARKLRDWLNAALPDETSAEPRDPDLQDAVEAFLTIANGRKHCSLCGRITDPKRGLQRNHRENCTVAKLNALLNSRVPRVALNGTRESASCEYESPERDAQYLTGCGKEFTLGSGLELWDFCPYCGKSVTDVTPDTRRNDP